MVYVIAYILFLRQVILDGVGCFSDIDIICMLQNILGIGAVLYFYAFSMEVLAKEPVKHRVWTFVLIQVPIVYATTVLLVILDSYFVL